MAGELSFFELGVDDPEKGRAFYEDLFGWTFEPGPSGQGFVIGTPGVKGGMHGGDKGGGPYVFFSVDDMDASVRRVEELGGQVSDIETDGGEEGASEYGRFKLCRDDQGSAFGLHQPPGRVRRQAGERPPPPRR